MRHLVALAVAAAAMPALAQSAPPTGAAMEFPGDAASLTGDAMRERLANKVFGSPLADGSSWRLDFRDSGYIFFDTSRGFRDTGKWRIEAPSLCFEMQKTGSSCNEVRSAGDRLYLQRTNGEVLTMSPK